MGNQPPNVLWICTDQQRFDTLGCYGNPFVKTPNIDRLAESGMLFENAYAQSPICTPSRASFLTGRYPRTTRCRQNGQSIPPDERMLPRLLKDQLGYVCGLSGKLHTSFCNPDTLKGTELRIDDGYDEFHWSHDPNPVWPTNEYINWLHSQKVTFQTPLFEDSKVVRTGMPEQYHQTTWCADKAINFIRSNADFDMPWLFSVNIFDPHHAFDPPAEYLARYLPHLDEIPLPNYTPHELDNKPHFQSMDHQSPYNGLHAGGFPPFDDMTDREHRLIKAAYWAMIDLIDVQVGRMISELEETGQLDNTIIIFMSDHGEMLGDHGIYLKGPHLYDPAIHVPLIMSLPGTIPAGTRSSALVELVDVAPTLMEAAGIEPYVGMQGHSFWPLLNGTAPLDEFRTDVYCEYYNALPFHQNPSAHITMVRTRQHKIAVFHGTEISELYDIERDCSETVNLWDDPDYAAVKSDMLTRLCNRMAWTVDPLPERLAEW